MGWAAAYLALGAVTGVFAGLFGIGGGLLLVPALLFAFAAQGFPSPHLLHLSLATAMASILFSSLASLRKHHQHGAVDWRVVRHLSPGILLGTALGAAFSAHIPAQFLGIFFALFVYLAAAQILLDIRPHAARQLPQHTGMTLFGIFTGWISSLVSIGGGTVVIPFLIWCNVPLRRAIGTSAAIGFPVALGGTLGYIVTGLNQPNLPSPHLGYVYLPALFWVALASIFTAPLGAKLAHRIEIGLLRKLFAVLLIVLATKLVLKLL